MICRFAALKRKINKNMEKNFYIFLPIFFYFFFPRPAGAYNVQFIFFTITLKKSKI